MQTTTKRVLTVSALALGLIAAATTATAATSGIANTRHNMGTSNRSANGVTTPTAGSQARDGDLHTSGTDEICVFCHTPHGSNTAAQAPLWNKALPASSNYTLYSSGTMQATATLTQGSMSLACLSCHDGTQAMDNMINAPTSSATGSGYDATGARLANSTWYAGTDPTEGTETSAGALTASAGVLMLGTDLSNDHPVGIKYCGGGAAAGSVAGCNDKDFIAPAVSGSGFRVGSSTTDKENMRLYGAVAADATVECASCHDPHNDMNKVFLRIPNSGSAVCLTCHVK